MGEHLNNPRPLFWAREDVVADGRHIVDWPPVSRTTDIEAEDGTVVAASVEVAVRYWRQAGMEP